MVMCGYGEFTQAMEIDLRRLREQQKALRYTYTRDQGTGALEVCRRPGLISVHMS